MPGSMTCHGAFLGSQLKPVVTEFVAMLVAMYGSFLLHHMEVVDYLCRWMAQ
jgi:hypothetical protein